MAFRREVKPRDQVVLRGRWQFEEVEMTVDLVSLEPHEIQRRFADCGHLDAYPVPADHDGPLFCLMQNGDPMGPCFVDPEAARAWADDQPWAPVEWSDPLPSLRRG